MRRLPGPVLGALLLTACATHGGPLTADDYRYLEPFGIERDGEFTRCATTGAEQQHLHELINDPGMKPERKRAAVRQYVDRIMIESGPEMQFGREKAPCK